jgi:hypothetical protein
MSLTANFYRDERFTLKTTIKLNGNMVNIYEYIVDDTCKKYFKFDVAVKYLAYIKDEQIYVLMLSNDLIDEPSTTSIDRSSILKLDYDIDKHPCANIINLELAKQQIALINSYLRSKNIEISLDYIYDMPDYTEINYFGANSREAGSTLLLCINCNKNCVASVIITYDYTSNNIYLDAFTNSQFEGRNMNAVLRSVLIIISKMLFRDAISLVSVAANPVSAHIMLKYFNATMIHEPRYSIEDRIDQSSKFEDIKSVVDRYDGIEVAVLLNEENISNAENKLYEFITRGKISCDDSTNARGKYKSFSRQKRIKFKTHKSKKHKNKNGSLKKVHRKYKKHKTF